MTGPHRARAIAAAWALPLLLAASAAAADPAAPAIKHDPVESFEAGQPVILRARITSPAGTRIFEPAAFVRPAGAASFERVPLEPHPRAIDLYEATIPAPAAGLEYYLEAFDEEGRGPSRTGSPERPLRAALARPAPEPAAAPKGPQTPALPAAPAPEPERPSSALHTAAVGLLIGGGTLLVGAATSGGIAWLSYKDEQQAAEDGDLRAYQSARGRVEAATLTADILLGAGLAAGAAGGLLLLLEPDEPAALTLGVHPGGLGLVLAGEF